MHRTSDAVSNTTVSNLAPRWNKSFLPACCCLALLIVGMFTQPAHALGVPAPRYAYVVDSAANAIDIFSITLSTGVLVHAACAPNPQPLGGFGIVLPTTAEVDPTGSFLYVSDQGGSQVIGFAIQPNGCLAFIPGSLLFTVGKAPSSLHISANGEFLYVSDTCPSSTGALVGCVEGFQINPNGTLIPLGPFVAGAKQGGIVVDPVRQYLYASDDSPGGPINETQFNPITGVLGPFAANPAVRPNPHRMALDPVGNGLLGGAATQFLLVVSDPPAVVVDCYEINTAGGAAVWAGAAPTGVNPHSVAATPLGQFAYITNNGANTVSAYNINNCAGILPDGAAIPTGAGPTGVTVDQTGRFVYVAATGANRVFGYRVNLLNGTLANIGNWPVAAGPFYIATMP